MSLDLLFAIGAAVIGLAIGSFLNVLIHRLPKMMENDWRAQCAELNGQDVPETPAYNLWMPHSHCPECKTPIREINNIPLISYLILRGKCAKCAAPISIRYPIVELLTAVLSVVVANHFGFGWPGGLALALVWTLIALAFIDADTTLLPDDLTLPLMWLGLIVNLFEFFVPLKEAVIGAAVGYLVLWSIYWLFKLVTGKEGMGYGDFKLLAALGAWLGWKMLLPIVLISAIVGAVIGFFLVILAKRGREIPIPFGPYLAAAGFIALIAGQPLQAWLVPL